MQFLSFAKCLRHVVLKNIQIIIMNIKVLLILMKETMQMIGMVIREPEETHGQRMKNLSQMDMIRKNIEQATDIELEGDKNMLLGCILILLIVVGGRAMKEGAFDNIYLIIIALLAIIYPALFFLYLMDGDKELILNSEGGFALMAIVTFAEIGGLIYLLKRKFLTVGTKNYDKNMGYGSIGVLIGISLIIIIRIITILM